MNIDNPQTKISFWEEINQIDFASKQNLDKYLLEKWGIPLDSNQTNLLSELSKKIYSYYQEQTNENYAIYSLAGSIENVSDIIEKKFKEGKRMGQTYYVLKIAGDKIYSFFLLFWLFWTCFLAFRFIANFNDSSAIVRP